MKIIEQLLLNLDPKNLSKSLNQINSQIEYFSDHQMDVAGISLMPVRDLLAEQYTDEMLRKNGYIFTVKQFEEDCDKYIKLAQEKPITYNSHLKRLYRGLDVLKQNYVLGNIHNTAVVSEMKQHFSGTLNEKYSQGSSLNMKMPQALQELIAKGIENEIEALNQSWFDNDLKANAPINEAFTNFIRKSVLTNWKAGILSSALHEQLAAEKQAINSTDALTNAFRVGDLPEEIQIEIATKLIQDISAELNAKKIGDFDAFGVAFKDKRSASIKTDNYHVLSAMITDWQNNQTTVAKDIEKYLSKVIADMKERLDSCLTQNFEQLAVKAYLEKLQSGYYEANEWLKDFSLDQVKLAITGDTNKDLIDVHQYVYDNVMEQLHDDWVSSKLPSQVNDFLKATLFEQLDQYGDQIEAQIWPNRQKSYVAQLETKIEQQNQLIESLLFGFEEFKQSLIQSNSTPDVERAAGKSTAPRPGFFGL